jgi:acyl-CoA thioesterase-1
MQQSNFILHLTLLIVLSFLFARSTIAESGQNKILILGDSLSAAYGIEQSKSWVELLSARLAADYNEYSLVNSSISGDTTANGLNRLPSELEQHHPAIVIIALGANDGLRGISLPYIKNNLQKLISQSLDANAKVLLAGIQIPPNYGKKYTHQFTRLYPALAQQYQTDLIPFLLQGVAGQPEMIQSDGLHPNQKAQPRIMQNVWEYLLPMLTKAAKQVIE